MYEVFPGRSSSFRYQCRPLDNCSPGRGGMVQDDSKRAERIMVEWIDAEKARAGLRHAAVNPRVAKMTKKRIAESKRARAGSLARP